MRILRLILLAAWRSAMDQWAWRSFLITLVLNQAIVPLIGFVVWRAVAPNDPQITSYFFILLIVQLATVSYKDHTLATAIYSGDLTGDLLQPQPIIVPFLGANLSMRFWHLVYGIPFVIILGVFLQVPLDLLNVAASLPALLLAGTSRFLFTTTVALTAFWSEQARNIVGLSNSLIVLGGGVAAPLFLLSSPLAGIGKILPFWSMLGFPAEVATGVIPTTEIWRGYMVQGIWLAIFGVAALVVWRSGLRRYTAIGA